MLIFFFLLLRTLFLLLTVIVLDKCLNISPLARSSRLIHVNLLRFLQHFKRSRIVIQSVLVYHILQLIHCRRYKDKLNHRWNKIIRQVTEERNLMQILLTCVRWFFHSNHKKQMRICIL